VLLRVFALVLALAAVALVAASGPGTRFGLWPYQVGFVLLRSAVYVGLGAAAVAVLALAIPRLRRGHAAALCVTLLLGAAAAAVHLEFRRQASNVPRIHDITTDTAHPPEFVATLPLRAGAPNPPGYDGKEVAELQRKAYPDIRPLELPVPPQQAFSKALAAAEAMGWEIVAQDPAAGRIEAIATTLWFDFKDDVVIRVAEAGRGSRIDIRSKSRVGRSDIGTNARRIRAYLERLK